MLADIVIGSLLAIGPIIAFFVGLLGAAAALRSLFRRVRPSVGLVLAAFWLPVCGVWYELCSVMAPFYPGLPADGIDSANVRALVVAAGWLGLALLANAAAKES